MRRASRDRSARGRASWARWAATSSNEIDRSKGNDLSRLIYALGIRHVGEKAAATLARQFRTMERVLDAPAGRMQSVADVGPVVAASVRAFADEPRNRQLIARLEEAGVNMTSRAPEPAARGGTACRERSTC